tara:strand:- start:547 stop:1050 length:504 start_codon:yes stop_codon:yes gene_type:complete
MGRYASGKHALGISDRSGRAYKLKDMVKEWNGLLVGKDEYESKQPQLEPRHTKADPQALRVSRPDRTEPAVEVLLPFNPFKFEFDSKIITVTEPGHNRSTGDLVVFRHTENFANFTQVQIEKADGYSITKISDDKYTYEINSDDACTFVAASGGGGIASAGPVTVSA